MKNKLKTKEKLQNGYDLFIDAVLSLPGDVRRDILQIGSNNCTNPYLYLFNRIQKKDVNDGVYGVLLDYNLLTEEMFGHE
jgi:hypothetical protein